MGIRTFLPRRSRRKAFYCFKFLLPLGEGQDEGGSEIKIIDLNSNPTLIATHIHVLSRNKRIPAQNPSPLPEGEGTVLFFSVTSAKLPRPAIAPYLHPCRQLRPALPYLHTSMYSSVAKTFFGPFPRGKKALRFLSVGNFWPISFELEAGAV